MPKLETKLHNIQTILDGCFFDIFIKLLPRLVWLPRTLPRPILSYCTVLEMSASDSDSSTQIDCDESFLERLNLPATIIQPPQVRDILYRGGVTDQQELKLLACTFFGIGSPEACNSLRQTLRMLREHGFSRLLPPESTSDDLEGAFWALIALECYERRNRIVQRQTLARIRECYEKHLHNRRSQLGLD